MGLYHLVAPFFQIHLSEGSGFRFLSRLLVGRFLLDVLFLQDGFIFHNCFGVIADGILGT